MTSLRTLVALLLVSLVAGAAFVPSQHVSKTPPTALQMKFLKVRRSALQQSQSHSPRLLTRAFLSLFVSFRSWDLKNLPGCLILVARRKKKSPRKPRTKVPQKRRKLLRKSRNPRCLSCWRNVLQKKVEKPATCVQKELLPQKRAYAEMCSTAIGTKLTAPTIVNYRRLILELHYKQEGLTEKR
jgi:hypothetical protein